MARILIIEDDEQKLRTLSNWVSGSFSAIAVDEAKSFTSGKGLALSGAYDLLLLDMTLPVYDVTTTETGYETMFFAGRELLSEMARKNVSCCTIVITQFEQFGEGDDRMTLNELKDELSEQFPTNYRGTVYYHPSQDSWQEEIRDLLPEDLR